MKIYLVSNQEFKGFLFSDDEISWALFDMNGDRVKKIPSTDHPIFKSIVAREMLSRKEQNAAVFGYLGQACDVDAQKELDKKYQEMLNIISQSPFFESYGKEYLTSVNLKDLGGCFFVCCTMDYERGYPRKLIWACGRLGKDWFNLVTNPKITKDYLVKQLYDK